MHNQNQKLKQCAAIVPNISHSTPVLASWSSSAMTNTNGDSTWVLADEAYFNNLAVQELADIVICGRDSGDESSKVCDHGIPGQWVCRTCANANWESRTACRRCAQQRSTFDWDYPARRATKPSVTPCHTFGVRPGVDDASQKRTCSTDEAGTQTLDLKVNVSSRSTSISRRLDPGPCDRCSRITASFCEKCCVTLGEAKSRGTTSFVRPLCDDCYTNWEVCAHCSMYLDGIDSSNGHDWVDRLEAYPADKHLDPDKEEGMQKRRRNWSRMATSVVMDSPCQQLSEMGMCDPMGLE